MEARIASAALLAATILSLGAGYRTQNFIISAPTDAFAREVGEAAERYRRELAIEWLGDELPPWQDPCPIDTNQVGPDYGAERDQLHVSRAATVWMDDDDPGIARERILDSVLPHEITHTIFATHFGGKLPRWADEGACTTVEHYSERDKQHQLLYEILTTNRGIAFNEMFAMSEYPADVLPLYSQGYALARFLIAQGGKRKFIAYIGDGMRWNNWTRATRQHYGYQSLSELQVTWLDWVRRGTPPLRPSDSLVVQASASDRDVVAEQLPLVPVPPAESDNDSSRLAARTGEPSESHEALASFAGENANASTDATGWYSRVRDETLALASAGSAPTGPSADPASQLVEPPVRATTARPQPVGRPRQIILEWSRPGPPSAAGPLSAPSARLVPVPRTYFR